MGWIIALLACFSALSSDEAAGSCESGSDGESCSAHRPSDPIAPHGSERSYLFCYAHARTPHDQILRPWIKTVSEACDTWVAFSWKAAPNLGIVKAYTREIERKSWEKQNGPVFLAAWDYINRTGAMNKYSWFLHIDIDTFVVPSRLKNAFLRYDPGRERILTQGGIPVSTDGFFVAVPRSLLQRLYAEFKRLPQCLEQVHFSKLSGHDESEEFETPTECLQINSDVEEVSYEMMADADGDALIGAYNHCDQLKGTTVGKFHTAPKQRWCDQYDNTLNKCFDFSDWCTKRGVDEEGCGRKLGAGACVSSHFIAMHPVKEKRDFEQLMSAFR